MHLRFISYQTDLAGLLDSFIFLIYNDKLPLYFWFYVSFGSRQWYSQHENTHLSILPYLDHSNCYVILKMKGKMNIIIYTKHVLCYV